MVGERIASICGSNAHLYVGIYTTLFINTTYALLWRRPLGHSVRFDLLWVSLLMFVIATMVSLCMLRFLREDLELPSLALACRHEFLTNHLRVHCPCRCSRWSSRLLQRALQLHANVRQYTVRHSDPLGRRHGGESCSQVASSDSIA